MKRFFLLAAILLLTGCAGFWTVVDIITEPVPIKPVCNEQNVGVSYQGETCLQWSDGVYRWTK